MTNASHIDEDSCFVCGSPDHDECDPVCIVCEDVCNATCSRCEEPICTECCEWRDSKVVCTACSIDLDEERQEFEDSMRKIKGYDHL